MFGDYTQDRYKRRIVKQGEQHWLICYLVGAIGDRPSTLDDLAKQERLALAVPCSARGDVTLTLLGATVSLIRFVDADMVNPATDEEAVTP